jgi:hypothetical protein
VKTFCTSSKRGELHDVVPLIPRNQLIVGSNEIDSFRLGHLVPRNK